MNIQDIGHSKCKVPETRMTSVYSTYGKKPNEQEVGGSGCIYRSSLVKEYNLLILTYLPNNILVPN